MILPNSKTAQFADALSQFLGIVENEERSMTVSASHTLLLVGDLIQYEVVDHCAYITINRPEKLNSLTRAMLLGLSSCLDQAADDRDVRVVVIQGNQKAFCTGQDLSDLNGSNPPTIQELLENYHDPIVHKIASMPKPVIAAVEGVAAGAGAVFAMACDLVIASESASFIFGFSQIGLTSGSGGSYFLTRKIGVQKTTALLLLGEKVSAQEAERIGMIHKSFPLVSYANELNRIVAQLTQLPGTSLGLTKELIAKASENDLYTMICVERRAKCQAGESDDFVEGLNAFMEKRKPIFNQNRSIAKPGSHVTRILLNGNSETKIKDQELTNS